MYRFFNIKLQLLKNVIILQTTTIFHNFALVFIAKLQTNNLFNLPFINIILPFLMKKFYIDTDFFYQNKFLLKYHLRTRLRIYLVSLRQQFYFVLNATSFT